MRLCAAILVLLPFITLSQGHNNDIRDRSKLVLDAEPTVSSTAGNTVEWDCLNKRLTQKCLVYHNDQWFTFKVEKAGDYFINIASKNCRDNMGVQLIIIEGNPCEVTTYHILECIRRIEQAEVYVALKDIKPDISYLINVDGFMGDFCDFKIQLATVPWKKTPPSVATEVPQKPVEIFWELKDDTTKSSKGFAVYRQREGRQGKQMIREMGLSVNALGAYATKYTMTDTLPGPGLYKYEIFGLLEDDRAAVLVGEQRIMWDGKNFQSWPPPPPTTIASFPLTARPGTPIEVVLLDDQNVTRLWTRKLVFDPTVHARMDIELEPWLQQGIKAFLVLVIDEEQREPVEYYFVADRNGNVTQQK